MSKAFWAIIAVIVVVFGAIVLFKDDKAGAPGGNNAKATNHIYSQGSTGVTLVEYGDFQCPACATFEPTVAQVREKYKDKITFQFRHLPLLQIHKNAFAAARAAEAASMQGKFWEMHDALYAGQPSWESTDSPQTFFESYAKQIGLDVNKFKTDAASSAVNDTINADLAAFDATGESKGTPTFLLDGKKITVDNTVDAFSKLIDERIAAKASEAPADR